MISLVCHRQYLNSLEAPISCGVCQKAKPQPKKTQVKSAPMLTSCRLTRNELKIKLLVQIEDQEKRKGKLRPSLLAAEKGLAAAQKALAATPQRRYFSPLTLHQGRKFFETDLHTILLTAKQLTSSNLHCSLSHTAHTPQVTEWLMLWKGKKEEGSFRGDDMNFLHLPSGLGQTHCSINQQRNEEKKKISVTNAYITESANSTKERRSSSGLRKSTQEKSKVELGGSMVSTQDPKGAVSSKWVGLNPLT